MSRQNFNSVMQKPFQEIVNNHLSEILLPCDNRLELSEQLRIINLLHTTSYPQIVAQQQFTKNEWSILKILLEYYPNYVSYHILLAGITSLSPTASYERLQDMQKKGGTVLRQELKPVYRVLSILRLKLGRLSPYIKISLIREIGYALVIMAEVSESS